jgi:hypothetical protein
LWTEPAITAVTNSRSLPISSCISSPLIELNPQENIWDEIREKIFKNYALKSMSDVNAKLDEASLHIERSRTLVKSIASFPYIAKSY